MNSIETLLAGKERSKGREVLPELVIENSTVNNNVQRVTRARKRGDNADKNTFHSRLFMA